jgi:membrane-bound lytic murein transglycosylase D
MRGIQEDGPLGAAWKKLAGRFGRRQGTGRKALVVGLAAYALGMLGATKVAHRTADAEGKAKVGKGLLGARGTSGALNLQKHWDLLETRNERVEFFLDFLMGRNYDNTRLWLERLGKFGPMILEELEARDMPRDLIYLAMIESGFSPNAYSHAHAVGIWQFIAETGQRYGLEVSEYVDERRDPVKSTTAALDYLEYLYERFGSWYLAAASYNTGENRVHRILRERQAGRLGDDDLYWAISPYIPRETRDYVPLMLAAAYIGKDPQAHGFHGLEFQEPLRYTQVRARAGTPLALVARDAGVSHEAVRELNPHLVRDMVPPDRDWYVRVPDQL